MRPKIPGPSKNRYLATGLIPIEYFYKLFFQVLNVSVANDFEFYGDPKTEGILLPYVQQR